MLDNNHLCSFYYFLYFHILFLSLENIEEHIFQVKIY